MDVKSKCFTLNSNFRIKSDDTVDTADTITLEGYANTTEKDRIGDVILEEAWNKGGLINYGKNPILLAFHDHSRPIGTVKSYSTDSKGLKITAEVTKAAGNIFNLIKEGILRTLSVSIRVKDADYDTNTDIFVIKDLELFEISVVSVPMNQNAVFSVRKSFDNTEDFNEFKRGFEMDKKQTTVEEVKTSEAESQKSKDFEQTVLDALERQSKAFDSKLNDILVSKTAAEEAEKTKEKEKSMPDVTTTDNVEKLLQEVQTKLESQETSFKDALAGLENELHTKAAELEALQKSKMVFEEKGNPKKIADKEKDTAILLGKIMNKPVEKTAFGKDLLEKAGTGPHLGSTTETWEEEFSTRLESDIRETLIMEPLFNSVRMNSLSMHIPVNPEAGYGEWIANTYPPNRSTDLSSTGTAVDHEITDTTLTAHKLVAKEYLAYEEEEDAIIPLMPIIRDAVVRRMGKASDRALLRADSGQATGDGDTYPFNGVATLATDASAETEVSIAGAGAVTIGDLQAARRQLGAWGLDPSNLVYVVSHDVYYDLMDDPDFRTKDLVGDNATILRGQVAMVNGSPVVTSGEFATKAANAVGAIVLYKNNFIVGNLRNMMVERDRDIENQKNIIVASRRMGFIPLIASNGVAAVQWVA